MNPGPSPVTMSTNTIVAEVFVIIPDDVLDAKGSCCLQGSAGTNRLSDKSQQQAILQQLLHCASSIDAGC
ncbi:hypothetical protein XELAEV_18033869mg [Xenopus laevis]|uniref:Uncharacterized protein n=1 Tax=Xenopus laevis TaxID=8355 RepID=A0A974HEC1_XENLA|nr:hypothetical protein XELAEV_18033869mg [Xenopus laevis]